MPDQPARMPAPADRRWTVLAALLMAATVSAQSGTPARVIGYPQSSTATWWGSHLPFGWVRNANAPMPETEVRIQQLIPARFLPQMPGRITAVSFQGQQTMPVDYPLLRITLSSDQRTALDRAFGINLPQPVVVYDKTNTTLQWTVGAPTTLPFQTPFLHDGSSDLVLEIRKAATLPAFGIGGLVQVAQDTERRDLPDVRYAVGGPGSFAWQSPLGKLVLGTNLKLWLHFEPAVDVLQVACPATLPLSPPFRLGSSVELTLVTDAGSSYAIFMGPGPGSTPSPLPGGLPGTLWLDPATAWTLQQGFATQGRIALTRTIPLDPNLTGMAVAAQAFVFNPTSTFFGTTNTVAAVLRP